MERKVDYILERLRDKLPELRKKYNIRSLEIFGSALRGDFTSQSDVDILAEFYVSPSLLKFVELENYLSDLLSLKVDLVMKDSLKPRIRKQILSETELV